MSGFKVFSRGKWTGAEEVYKSALLLESTHGLLSVAVKALCADKKSDKDDDAIKGRRSQSI